MSVHTNNSIFSCLVNPVKLETSGTVILPPMVSVLWFGAPLAERQLLPTTEVHNSKTVVGIFTKHILTNNCRKENVTKKNAPVYEVYLTNKLDRLRIFFQFSFKKMYQTRPLFGLFLSFSQHNDK